MLESDEVSPEEEDAPDAEVPERAKSFGLMEALAVADVKGLVANAKSQRADLDEEKLFEAFLYYDDNDAS